MKKLLICIFIITIILNILSIFVKGFADIYALYVFPAWVNTLGRLTTLASISVGEIMIILGLLWILALVIGPVIFLIRRKESTKKHYLGFCRATAVLLVIIFLIMTLNCFINYHTTPIASEDSRQYTISELAQLRDFIVEKCNELSEEIERDENGMAVYTIQNGINQSDTANKNSTTNKLMAVEAAVSMEALANRFPRLSGFYVMPKPLFFSGFVSQQNMQGYFFPFSMEANYNDIMYIMNKPFTMCHELAHTKSYIMEDEANFLAYLACTGSEDTFFRYSGYLGVLNYVNNAFYENVSKEEYASHVKISDTVKRDNIFLTKENWDKVEENAVIPTETVKKAADTFVDTTLKVNGIDDGIASYNRVVELLLTEYFK